MSDIILSNTLDHLINEIEKVVSDEKENVAYTVNRTITQTHRMIGKYIVEFEQEGKAKTVYGSKLLITLSKELTLRLGKGYSRPNLNNMRKFYLHYPC